MLTVRKYIKKKREIILRKERRAFVSYANNQDISNLIFKTRLNKKLMIDYEGKRH